MNEAELPRRYLTVRFDGERYIVDPAELEVKEQSILRWTIMTPEIMKFDMDNFFTLVDIDSKIAQFTNPVRLTDWHIEVTNVCDKRYSIPYYLGFDKHGGPFVRSDPVIKNDPPISPP